MDATGANRENAKKPDPEFLILFDADPRTTHGDIHKNDSMPRGISLKCPRPEQRRRGLQREEQRPLRLLASQPIVGE